MKAVIQRVSKAAVKINEEVVGAIGQGYLVLLGVTQEDTQQEADKLINKLIHLRLFQDDNDKTNLSLMDVSGELLVVSQFTLLADCRKGRRPSFVKAGNPEHAKELYEYFIRKCRESVPVVRHGSFGAVMEVALVNDGPFTIVLDTDEL